MTPMYAVVSLLNGTSYGQVEGLWAELQERCGVKGIYATPFPHFSYHVAPAYEMARLERWLRRAARSLRPFTVCTSGLGIFTGLSSVLYIPVVRSPELTRVHGRIWPRADAMATGSVAYYHPDRWIPHITLGHGDLCQANLPDVVRLLGDRSFTWEITIDNLAIISSQGPTAGLHLRVPLGQQMD